MGQLVKPPERALLAKRGACFAKDKQVEMHYYEAARPPFGLNVRVRLLLDRYPNLGEEELAELINLLPQVPPLDLSQMTTNDRLAAQLAEFREDRGDKRNGSVSGLVWLLAFPLILGIGAIVWLRQ